MNISTWGNLGVCAVALSAAAWTDARAQAAADIVVTAQRRTERLQDVPVAVSVISADKIAQSEFRSLTDLQYLAPSVQFNSYGGAGFQIRGVGTQGFDYSLEKAVSLVVDEVVQGVPRDPVLNSLTDIESVEILRGPQGTLFGRNSTAGVISIKTKRPALGKFSADARVSYGTDNETLVQGNVNIPVGETTAMRLSAFTQHRDGFIENVVRDEELGGSNDWGVRGKLLWAPNDKLSVLLNTSYQRTVLSNNYQTSRSYGLGGAIYGPLNELFGVEAGPENEKVADASLSGSRYRVFGSSLEIDYDFGNLNFASVTSYRRLLGDERYISDALPIDLIDLNVETHRATQITQEFRLASPSEDRLNYVVGAFFYKLDTDATQIQAGKFGASPVLLSPTGGKDNFDNESTSYALFGQATFRATDHLRLIAGARYTNDTVNSDYKTVSQPGIFALGVTALPGSTEAKHNNISGRLGVQYDFSEDVMGYATYVTGYKGPAVSNLRGEALVIKPETTESYELGLKSEFLDKRVVLNLAAFYQESEDFQAQTYDTTLIPAQFRLGNAGGLETKGVELELTVNPVQNLTLSASASYIDATFSDYTAACYIGQPISATVGVGCYLDPQTGNFVANLAGEPLASSPEWSYALSANYSRPVLGTLEVSAGASFSWKDDVYTITPDPNTIIEARGLLNANLGIGAQDGRWRAGVFARNITDEQFVDAIFPNFFDPLGYNQAPSAAARRVVGVSLDYKLGD